MSDVSDTDDIALDAYELEEYDIGPSEQQVEQFEANNVDFRMGWPPSPQQGGEERGMEYRLRAQAAGLPPEGMQLSGPAQGSRSAATQQTGPKAVKADYERAKQIMKDKRMRADMERQRVLEPQKRITAEDLKLPDQLRKEEAERRRRAGKESDDEDEDSDDEEARAAFEKYKQQRIAVVQSSLPRFGKHERVSKAEFANLVKNVHELVYVVCHLYENSIESCTRLNLCLESLAPQFPHVRFVRLRASEGMPNFPRKGLPCLLVYKGGEMLHQAIRATDALPGQFGDLDVARMLQAKGILTVPTGLKDYSSSRVYENREWSDEENAAAAAENDRGASSFGIEGLESTLRASTIAGSTAANATSSSSSSATARLNKSKLQRGKFSSHRAADSSDDDDSD